MAFRVRLFPMAAEALRVCAPATRQALRATLRGLAQDPTGRQSRLEVKELASEPRLFRVRIRDWRIVFALEGKTIIVVRVFPRSEGYGWLERFGVRRDRGGREG